MGLLLHQDLVVGEWPTSQQPLSKVRPHGDGQGGKGGIKKGTVYGAVAAAFANIHASDGGPRPPLDISHYPTITKVLSQGLLIICF